MPQPARQDCSPTIRGGGWLLLLLVVLACGEEPGGGISAAVDAAGDSRPARRSVGLVEITGEIGLDFHHAAGPQDEYPMPAVMSGGGASFDHDADGDLDLYFVSYGSSDRERSPAGRNRLYRQESDGSFRDVTEASGLGDEGRGMGCAVGDVDNDGDLDVFVSNWGPDALYRNRGDGTFEDVSHAFGIGDAGFGTSAVFLDYDRDGFLDLFVARYVAFDPGTVCTQEGGRRDYCGPTQFAGLSDLLYHNEGGSGFREVSREAGIATRSDAGLGVVAADFDDDGWIDVYVANDADPNHLWINQRDGRFREEALLLGAALNEYGVSEAGMGVAAGDVDGDGYLDLFMTHLIEETNTFYRNLGALGFEDATAAARLTTASVPRTGFGTALFDADNDGDLDLGVVNGGVKRRPEILDGAPPGFWAPYAEPNQLFSNQGDASFSPWAPEPRQGWDRVEVSRGLIPADLDGDGDIDLVVTNIDGPARAYRNSGGDENPWIEIRLLDPRWRREAVGAKVTVVTAGHRFVRHALPPGGYLTSGHARIHLGLGVHERIERFEVRWPDGTAETFAGRPARRVVELVRGEGGR